MKEKVIPWYKVVSEIKNYKHKVGDVIYPFSEEGSMLRKKKVVSVKKCWIVVEKVSKEGYWTKLEYMYNNETAELYGFILSGRKLMK